MAVLLFLRHECQNRILSKARAEFRQAPWMHLFYNSSQMYLQLASHRLDFTQQYTGAHHLPELRELNEAPSPLSGKNLHRRLGPSLCRSEPKCTAHALRHRARIAFLEAVLQPRGRSASNPHILGPQDSMLEWRRRFMRIRLGDGREGKWHIEICGIF